MTATHETEGSALEPWNPNDFEAALLGSIDADVAPAAGLRRTLSAVAAASATGVTVHAAGIGGVKSLLTVKGFWLWGSLVLACGVAGMSLLGIGLRRGAPEGSAGTPASGATAASAPAFDGAVAVPEIVTVSVGELPSAGPTEPVASARGSASPSSREARPPAASARAKPTGPSPTDREIALLQRVRVDLDDGRASRAVAALRAIERERSIRTFEPEARVLMIEALTAAGSSDEARDRADAFLRDLPNDPHVSRVRRLRGVEGASP